MTVELRSRGDDTGYVELRIEVDHRCVHAAIGFVPGEERYIALLLHELVARGQLDARVVQHWFEICVKGDGPEMLGNQRERK